MSPYNLKVLMTFNLILLVTISGFIEQVQSQKLSSQSRSSLQNCSLENGAPLFFYKKVSSTPMDIVYSTYTPVIFDFVTPNWTRPLNPTTYTCTGDNYEVDGYSCPVLWYWLTGVRDSIQDEIFVDNLKIKDSSSFLSQNPGSCDQITQFLEGTYLSPAAKTQFLESFSTNPCVGDRVLQLQRVSDYSQTTEVMDSPYRRMREKFYEEYYLLQTPDNRSNDAAYTNMRLNIDDAGLSNYYRESQRWKDGLRDCSNKRIPKGLLTPAQLASALQTVSEAASSLSLTLAIPVDKLSTYYKEPLVDCAFTEDSLLLVLQVPLKERAAVWEEVSLISIPEVKTSPEDGTKSICDIHNLDNSPPLLYDSGSKVIVEPGRDGNNLYGSRLRHVPEVAFLGQWSAIKRTRSCAASLLRDNGNDRDMREVCDYGCMSIDGLKPPMVKRIGSDKFAIVGGGSGSSESIKVVCPGKEDEYVTSSDEGGAMEVQVPCGCTLVSPTHEKVFKVGVPCSSEFYAFEIHSNY